MQIDFFELIKKSYRFTMKYKVLWIFGFILALTSLGGSSSNNSSRSSNRTTNLPEGADKYLNQFQDSFSSFSHQPYFMALVVVGIVLLILLSVLFWYLSRVSSISIYRAVTHDDDGKSELIGFKKLWNESQSVVWRVMLYDLIWFLVIFLGLMVFLIPIILLTIFAGPLAIILFCCGFILLIPCLIILVVLNQISMYLVMNKDYRLQDSISKAWTLMKKETGNIILYFLSSILVALPYIFALFLGIIVLAIILGIPFVLIVTAVNSAVIIAIVAVVFALLFLVTLAAIGAPFQVFTHAYQANVINALLNKLENPTPKLVEIEK